MVAESGIICTSIEIVGKKAEPPDDPTSSSSSPSSTVHHPQHEADFEEAIAATGYGRFNILILFIASLCCISSISETTAMSLILPAAQCDLELTLQDKGTLNAITYAGMITSAFMWGYLADTLGRREILMYGYVITGVFDVACALSQKFWILLMFKFIAGFVSCGPFAVLMTYISEFHGVQYRSRAIMTMGFFFSFGNIILPILAWIILPQIFDIVLIDNSFELHSWHIFLLVCSIPSLLGGALVIFLPESPKFLMSRGRNDEAMAIFQNVFHVNTGKDKNEYPINLLINETRPVIATLSKDIENHSPSNYVTTSKGFAAFKGGLSQVAPMFRPPHLRNCALAYTIHFGLLFSLNTIRLWLPQLFTMIAEFEERLATNSSWQEQLSSNENSLCSIINMNAESSNDINKLASYNGTNDTCHVTTQGDMYLNTVIVGFVTLGGYFFAGSVINAIGSRQLLIIGLITAGMTGIGIYWAVSSIAVVILSSLFVAIGSIGSTALISLTVNIIPTSLRTMTVSLTLMFGRTGALIGNLVFPYLLSLGCLPPFITVGSIMAAGGLLCATLPKNNKTPLQ